jgi:hypothetical protein
MQRKIKRIKLGKQIYRRLMKRVLDRDGWRCQKCGSLENLQIHHKIKRSQQGNDSLDNLVTVCLLPHGRAWAAFLFSYSSQSVHQAKATCEVKTLSAVISGVDNPRSSANGHGRALEVGAE